jgi:hypothetical protein
MPEIFTLLESGAKFTAFRENMKYAHEAILAEWAAAVRDKARERYRRGESRSFRAHRKPPNKKAPPG